MPADINSPVGWQHYSPNNGILRRCKRGLC